MKNKPYVNIAGVHITVSRNTKGMNTALVMNPLSLSTLFELYAYVM